MPEFKKWYTREHAMVDRIACPWLVRRFIDADAEFRWLPRETNWSAITDGYVYDVPNVAFGHVDGRCSFESIMLAFGLTEPALVEMSRIVHNADTDDTIAGYPEGEGLKAIARGMRETSADDPENLARSMFVYDALYAYCQWKVRG